MADKSSFKMSQDYELVPPKRKRAYPILVEEWDHLKEKIRNICDDANLYHTIGSVLLGVAGSAFVAATTLDIPKPPGSSSTPLPLLIAWFTFVSASICGGLALFFGKTQRKTQATGSKEVIEQMELIEKRYEGDIVFEDDFEVENKGWILNYWDSNNPTKTNRIENSKMIFEASDSELVNPKKEFGAYFNLHNGIVCGNTYEVSCRVMAAKQTTMQFMLWLHDTAGGSDTSTPLRTPQDSFSTIKLYFVANNTSAIRIHLHNRAGAGQILVDNVVVRKM